MKPTLGRHTLHGELGRGAISVIYRGYDPGIGRMLAIKTLRPEYVAREDYRERFLAEARIAGTLSHPGIVTIFDVGTTDGEPFIAMELLRGPTLAAHVRKRGRLPLRTVIRIATQVADALDYAHRHGVVHQDIKPDNIAVTSASGNVKVMDFGIARLRRTAKPGGDAGNGIQPVAGTPQYMSPEQIRGKGIDGRSDLYALGVVLYWLLAGRTPFEADDVDVLLRKILNDAPPPLKPLDPATPDALLDVVRTLLAKDAAERYQSGSELIEDLRRIDDALAEREDAWAGRRIIPIRVRWTAVMGLLVALTVTLGLGVVYYKQNQAMQRLAFDYGLTLTHVLAAESAENLLLDDHIAMQAMVNEMARNREIVDLAISNRSGHVVASTDSALIGTAAMSPPAEQRLLQRGAQTVYAASDSEGKSFFLFESPIQYERHELGRLKVGLSTDSLAATNRTTLIAMIAVMLVTLLAVFIGAYMLSRRLVVPIETLRAALVRIGQGRFDTRIRMHRSDEFERVFAACNTMADSLEARMLIARSSGPGSARHDRRTPAMAEPEPTEFVP
ncbi:serine/threonine protein kinase [Azoarcus sp. DD4]|uniref:protein kinase domain-containing protein n=1 Tax=Azoarcus sp. DD4 TaxID=2027405 RepID=UPI00112ADEE7|nr:protein kinase [Azoarcus sp. DD4]QDF96017.1 serine/threonine protein kinase [Azoarcus sp. DD4]